MKPMVGRYRQSLGKMVAIVVLLIYVMLAITFLINYRTYLNRPGDQTWDLAKQYLLNAGYGMEPIQFNPDWLKNYASDWGRLQGFNLSACNGCQSYWLISMVDEQPQKGYATIQNSRVNNIYVNQIQANNAGNTRPKNIILFDPKITISSLGGNISCPFSDGTIGPECYSEDWQKIERMTMTFGGDSRLCLFVHPRNNKNIILEYPEVKMSGKITFSTAISQDMISGDMAQVYADIYVNGEQIGKLSQEDVPGWKITALDTTKYSGQKADVKLVVYTNDDRRRHYCITANTG